MVKTISELAGRRAIPGDCAIEVEAEFSGPLRDELFPGFFVTGDGSLRGYGYEFVSERPKSVEGVLADYTSLLHTDSWKNFNKSNRAGIHVHKNVLQWSQDRLLRFLLAYYLVEEVMLSFCGEDRIGNLFCLSMNNADSVLDAITLVVDEKYDSLYDSFNTYKYAALNLASIPKLGSVEFRALPSNGDYEELKQWLGMIQSLSDYSEINQSLEDVYRSWERDRIAFCRQVLGWCDNTQAAYERLDTNRSNAYRIISLVNTKDDRKIKYKKKITYSFPVSEVAVDTGEDVYSYNEEF